MEPKVIVGYLDFYSEQAIPAQWNIDPVGNGDLKDFVPIEEGDHLVVTGKGLPPIFNQKIEFTYNKPGGPWFPKGFSADVWSIIFQQASKLQGILIKNSKKETKGG